MLSKAFDKTKQNVSTMENENVSKQAIEMNRMKKKTGDDQSKCKTKLKFNQIWHRVTCKLAKKINGKTAENGGQLIQMNALLTSCKNSFKRRSCLKEEKKIGFFSKKHCEFSTVQSCLQRKEKKEQRLTSNTNKDSMVYVIEADLMGLPYLAHRASYQLYCLRYLVMSLEVDNLIGVVTPIRYTTFCFGYFIVLKRRKTKRTQCRFNSV